ncbi:MAG: MoxR family ATPase [Deltaproteobacteria bacterium]|nr:MoxR family ATPase [Deltaproteobacteria bacterium]
MELFLQKLEKVKTNLKSVIRGKDEQIEFLLAALIARGHVLLEDLPGVGKTTLAKALAKSIELKFSRIQFTPDLLPADLLGMSLLNPKEGTFTFTEGPVFTNLLLADEINRASPRTQSALLEAMNEGQVSIDNVTRTLQDPFIVIATQNPVEHQGTYPLPEAQLDRFLMRITLGYPTFEEELNVLFDRKTDDPLDKIKPVLTVDELVAFQKNVTEVTVDKDVAKYILNLITATRNNSDIAVGASPRASLSLYRASQAMASLKGREHVTPGDIQQLFIPVIEHRVILSDHARYGGTTTAVILNSIVEREKVPK